MIAIGIDAGTQSIKTIAYDTDGRKTVAAASAPLPLFSKEGGVREQETLWWEDALFATFDALPVTVREKADVIGVSGQQHGFVALDGEGRTLCPVKLWCDTSTARECDELTTAYGGRDKLVEKLGNPILPGYTASKILHLKKTRPEIFDRMATVMLPHDWINFRLTGVRTMEEGDASGTGLMDIRKGKWDSEICAMIDPGLCGKLPPVTGPGIIGTVTHEISSRFHINPRCLVSSGGGDNMMGAIGTGTVCDGAVTISLGTSGTLYASTSRIVEGNGALAAFRSSHSTHLPLLCTMNCTVATELVRKHLGAGLDEFDRLLSDTESGSGGVLTLPFFNGERTPDLPGGKGTVTGLTPMNITPGNLVRSAVEGVSYGFLSGLDAFRASGITPEVITVTGGGSKSLSWRQLLADMTGCTVRTTLNAEAAATGAALHASWLAMGGTISSVVNEHVSYDEGGYAYPRKEERERYAELYGKWLGYVDALSPLFR